MGLLENLFKIQKTKKKRELSKDYFKMLNGYTPAFTTYNGGIYEMEITRAAITCLCLPIAASWQPDQGSAYKNLGKEKDAKKTKMNPFMDTLSFFIELQQY